MIEMFIVFFFFVIGVLVAIKQRQPEQPQDLPVYHAPYHGDKNYQYSSEQAYDIIDAASLAEQRRSGRNMGWEHHVYYNTASKSLSTEFEVRNVAAWLDKFGPPNNVHIHYMDGDREISELEKQEWSRRNHV